jgi:MFS family permease
VHKIFKKFNNPFIAFKSRNFRYYWSGWMFSLVGTWMQSIAQPWLAYKLTDSPFLLSLVGALQFLPLIFLSLFAGVLLDRFPKRTILVITQSCSLIIALIPAILVWTGHIQYWHILILAFLIGIINSIDMPARQSFVVEIVGRENTMNAVGLTSATFNTARIIGPAVAGIIMGTAGIGWCFFINSMSYGALLVALIFIKPEFIPQHRLKPRNIFSEIGEGLRYVRDNENISRTLIMVGIVATFSINFQVLVPVFTKMVLNGGEAGFGFMMSCVGAGSLCGALGVATMSKNGPRKFNLQVMPVIAGAMLVLTGIIANSFIIYAACLFLSGFFFVSFSSSSNSNVQISASSQYRGRVMSIYTLVFSGSVPFGSLYTGFFTGHFGARAGYFACGGIILLLIGALFLFRHKRKV